MTTKKYNLRPWKFSSPCLSPENKEQYQQQQQQQPQKYVEHEGHRQTEKGIL